MSSQPRPAPPRKAVALQGRGKAEVRTEAGEEQYMRWRRGYHVRPPQGEPDDDPRYATLPPEARPRGESLHDVTLRLLPYWYDAVSGLEVPNATPLLYEFPAGQPGQPG